MNDNLYDRVEEVVAFIETRRVNYITTCNTNNGEIKKQVELIYAPNGTGKTRLSKSYASSNYLEEGEFDTIVYNAFVEDLFIWNNEDVVLRFDPKAWFFKVIDEQGLHNNVAQDFITLINKKIQPSININDGFVSFEYVTGSDDNQQNIKISRGEESIFIWVVFYTALNYVIDELEEKEEDRTVKSFDKVRKVVIDDPVSSIDDQGIYRQAVWVCDLIKEYNNENTKLNFVITSHHSLFFNLLSIMLETKGIKLRKNILRKDNNTGKYEFSKLEKPFTYHRYIMQEISDAIKTNSIERHHFNELRSLMEKTAAYFGYTEFSWCLAEEDRELAKRYINAYSHDTIGDFEYRDVPDEAKELFEKVFNSFKDRYGWNCQ